MTISIIACVDLNFGLGYENELLVKISHDLERFKKLTTGNVEGGNFVLYGRKTYDSIGRKLPNRINLIVSRDKKFEQPLGTFLYQSIADVITEYSLYNDEQKDLWVCGGSSVYEQTIQYADRLYLTVIDHEFSEVDTYFPKIDLSEWKVIEESESYIDEVSQLSYKFVTYEHIK